METSVKMQAQSQQINHYHFTKARFSFGGHVLHTIIVRKTCSNHYNRSKCLSPHEYRELSQSSRENRSKHVASEVS